MNSQRSLFPDVLFLSAVTDERVIALTFDDCPDINTPRLLDILADKGVRATFYVLGSNVKDHPDTVQRMVAEGHEVGNHSWSHPDFRELPDLVILNKELHRTSQIVADLTGIYPKHMRPPYGAVRDSTIGFLGEAGWKIVNWSVDSFDWDIKQNSAAEITSKVLGHSHPGAIILMHSGVTLHGTVAALPYIIQSLVDDGYKFLTVSELLGFSSER